MRRLPRKLPKEIECAIKIRSRTEISTGEFRFPNAKAAGIAVETVSDFLGQNSDRSDRIIFNVYKDLDKELY